MKKVFDQTVRDLKREVNKKVLKVPGIEQKVLDATSNEPWGPHGSNLADIALATRNYHEYQMIMTVIWKRINDTGKNWRHVYKALTVLEYLVANGSERVIDEIREHAYQLSTLSDFQYIDSAGRDQGSNVRRKSLGLVSLVNDKERVLEVRHKALNTKDKYRGTSSTREANRPGGYDDRYYDDDRYGNREDDRNGYGKERYWGSKDDDRYGRSKDPYSRDGDRYGRDLDDRCVRDSYRDDDYRGRGNDDNQYGSRNRRSTDRDTERSYEDDDRYSSRGSGGRADGFPQDERRPERKLSDPVGAPPSYEEVVKDAQNHIQDEKDGGSVEASSQNASSPVVPKVSSPTGSTHQGADLVVESVPVAAPTNNEVDAFDEFDPRCSLPAAPPASISPDMDFFGSISLSDPNALALMPATSVATSEPDTSINAGYVADFAALSTASTVMNQPGENPFGDPPFMATPPENFPSQPQSSEPTTFQPPVVSGVVEPFPSVAQTTETVPNFDFGDALGGLTYTPSMLNGQHSSTNFASQPLGFPEAQVTNDILDALLPPTGVPTIASSLPAQPPGMTHMQTPHLNLPPQTEISASLAPQSVQFPSQVSQPSAPSGMQAGPPGLGLQSSAVAAPSDPLAALTTAPSTIKSQPSIDKFEPKSTVWADTLSRGLVNLNISGPKINPLADIGIDFESINRKEKREAKSSAAPVTSTITMGKAMGTGSGIGRAGASGLAPIPNPMGGSGIGMGARGGGPGMGMGVGMGIGSGYGTAMNQPMGMGGMNMGMGMGMGMNMNMNMGMGMAPGAPMRPPMGMPPPPQGPGMPGAGYNPMMGPGPYSSQQPYGGGYR